MNQVDEFLSILDRLKFEYEHYPDKSLIRIGGKTQLYLGAMVPIAMFFQDNKRIIEFYDYGDYVSINIMNFAVSDWTDFRFPKNWKIKLKECCLEIIYQSQS
jgi:hypothetical protein